jgi:lysophospholipase L1-like esterase
MHYTPSTTGPFHRLVVSGESTVAGGGWLDALTDRWADVLARLLAQVQETPPAYDNDGIGASVISPASVGYDASAKPSLAERYADTVLARDPDLWVLAYGLNDMRSGMPVEAFIGEMTRIVADVQARCRPVAVLCTVYHMTGWTWYPPFDRGTPDAAARYNAAIRALAAERGCLCADLAAAMAGADALVHTDGVHAGTVGNLVVAHEVFRAFAVGCPGLLAPHHARHADTEWTRIVRGIQGDAVEPSEKEYWTSRQEA